jgi:hypothetical protein
MDDLKSIFDLIQSIGGPQTECEALKEWLAVEKRLHETKIQRIIAVAFGGFAAGILALIAEWELLTALPWMDASRSSAGVLVILGVMTVSVGAVTATSIKVGKRWVGQRRYRDPEIRRAMFEVGRFSSMRRLRRAVGDNGIAELNEGATQLLRCKSSLAAEAWLTLSPGDPWNEARDEMLRSMDTAMGRLLVLVMNRRSFTEISTVLEQMRAAANEAVRVTEVRSHSSGSTGRDLRASIARMRELTVAEDELLHIREL